MSETEQHEYESPGDYQRAPDRRCSVCGYPFDTEIHHVVPEGWCEWDMEDHDYPVDGGECRRCGAEEPWDEEDED
ncbi:MAG TPA: hypothetical protein VGH72_33655 [Pseudonocardia sp.]|jgi:hypothetical protein